METFPQELAYQHDISRAYDTNVKNWFTECIETIRKQENKTDRNVLLIWSTKIVHRNKTLRNNNDLIIFYKGQCGQRTHDFTFDKLIEGEISGYFFEKINNTTHRCYEIKNALLSRPRGNKHTPPVYEIILSPIDESSSIKDKYPEYFNNTFRHPHARVKLESMAKYGFVPMHISSITTGLIDAYHVDV